jgi:hypothetical protein
VNVNFELNTSLNDLINSVGDNICDAVNVILFFNLGNYERVYVQWAELCRNDTKGDEQLCLGTVETDVITFWINFTDLGTLTSGLESRGINFIGWISWQDYHKQFINSR